MATGATTNWNVLLNRKVDLSDFYNELRLKADKNEFNIVTEQVKMLHKFIEQLAQMMHHQIKQKLQPKNLNSNA